MVNTLKSFFTKHWFNILIIVLYIFIVTITMFHHEMWRDETRVWMILSNDNLKQIYNDVRFEGHLYLWHIILFPFIKTGVNIAVMQLVSALFCTFAVILFMFKAPFDKFIKFLFVFSAGMLYFLPIIARPYCLIPLLIFALAYI